MMIWGYGDANIGPYRTAAILTGTSQPKENPLSPEVEQRLIESVETSRSQGAVEGYRFLNKGPGEIDDLGASFLTKWLYFVTARGDEGSESAAPVLDKLILGWLRRNTKADLREGYTDDYARYIDLLRAWGAPHDLTPVQVEERIFRLIRADGE